MNKKNPFLLISPGNINNTFIIKILLFTMTATTSFYCNGTPISWDELRSPTLLLRRDPEMTAHYMAHREQLFARGKTPEQVILMDIFGMSEQNAATYNDKKSKETFKLVLNRFPYWLEKNIAHLLVFSNKSNWHKEHLTAASKQLLSEQLPQVLNKQRYEVFIHVNAPSDRTVKKLGHAHIFIRDNGQPLQIHNLVKKVPSSKPE